MRYYCKFARNCHQLRITLDLPNIGNKSPLFWRGRVRRPPRWDANWVHLHGVEHLGGFRHSQLVINQIISNFAGFGALSKCDLPLGYLITHCDELQKLDYQIAYQKIKSFLIGSLTVRFRAYEQRIDFTSFWLAKNFINL